jgi:putative chitinase
MAMGAPGTADATPRPAAKPTVQQQAAMTPIDKLKLAAHTNGIRGTELAQFLAQCAHESANFTRMEEIGGANYFAKKYDPKYAPKTARILGNVQPGDGERYKGRGFIQLTGRDNYKRAGRALNLPLEANPDLAARPDVAALVAVWYWKNRVANKVTNFSNTKQVTQAINPATKGLEQRKDKFKQYQLAMR